MANVITNAQKTCLFLGGTVYGAPLAASLTHRYLSDPSFDEIISRNFSLSAVFGFVMLSWLFFVMIFGAWLGGTVSCIWQSPPGSQLFWTLSGGMSGGILGMAGATNRWVCQGISHLWTSTMPQFLVFGFVVLAGTLLGLLVGLVIGRWHQSVKDAR